MIKLEAWPARPKMTGMEMGSRPPPPPHRDRLRQEARR